MRRFTPGAAEFKRILRSLSFARLTLFEVAIAFRRRFASSSHFRKASHFFWCLLRPPEDTALNLSGQCLHANINNTERVNNSEKKMAIRSFGRLLGCFAIGEK